MWLSVIRKLPPNDLLHFKPMKLDGAQWLKYWFFRRRRNLTKTTHSWSLCPIGSSPYLTWKAPEIHLMASSPVHLLQSHLPPPNRGIYSHPKPSDGGSAVAVVLDGSRDDLWRRSRATASLLNWTCQTKPPICICNPSATLNLPIKLNQLNTDVLSSLAKWFWVNFLWKSQIQGFECHAWGGCETYLSLESSLKIKFNPHQSLSNWA